MSRLKRVSWLLILTMLFAVAPLTVSANDGDLSIDVQSLIFNIENFGLYAEFDNETNTVIVTGNRLIDADTPLWLSLNSGIPYGITVDWQAYVTNVSDYFWNQFVFWGYGTFLMSGGTINEVPVRVAERVTFILDGGIVRNLTSDTAAIALSGQSKFIHKDGYVYGTIWDERLHENALLATMSSARGEWMRFFVYQNGRHARFFTRSIFEQFTADTEFELFIHDPNRKLQNVFIDSVSIEWNWNNLHQYQLEYNYELEGFLFTFTVEDIMFESVPNQFRQMQLEFFVTFYNLPEIEINNIHMSPNGAVSVNLNRLPQDGEVVIIAIYKDGVFQTGKRASRSWFGIQYYVDTFNPITNFEEITIKAFVWESMQSMIPIDSMAVEWCSRFLRWVEI